MKLRHILLSVSLLLGTSSWAQVVPVKHVITLKIKGLPKDTCLLVNYFGDKQYVQDTALVGKDGSVVFNTSKGIPAGMYMLVQNKQRIFDFPVVDQETEFLLESDTQDLVGRMRVLGSSENRLFFEYLNTLERKRKEAEPYRLKALSLSKNFAAEDSLAKTKGRKAKIDSTEFKKEVAALSKIDAEVKSYITEFIKTNSGSFIGRFVKSTQDVQIPAPPKAADGKIDSTYAYRYYKKHYWDNYDLNDERLVYAPLFHSKLKNYMSTMIVPLPDSVKHDINNLIKRVEPNKEIFKYVVHVATAEYETSKQMGMDAVFVDLVEKYYNTNKVYWIDSVTLYKYKKRAEQLSYTLIGHKVPNVIMQDTTVYRSYSLHDVKARFTIVYIWDPNCGHCQKETPILVDLYNKNKTKYGMEVFAIGTGFSEMKPWVDFIKKNKMNWINVADLYNKTNYSYLFDVYSTPVVYVLDKNKTIIAKRIPVEQLIGFLDFWQRVHPENSTN